MRAESSWVRLGPRGSALFLEISWRRPQLYHGDAQPGPRPAWALVVWLEIGKKLSETESDLPTPPT